MSEAEISDGFLENTSIWIDLEPKLDTHSIPALAKEYQVQAGQIAAALKRTGRKRVVHIPADGGLPPEPGEAASASQKRAKSSGKRRTSRGGAKSRRLEEHRELLGTIPDAEVARITGVSPRLVADFRSRNGIPGYQRWSDANRDRTQKRPSRIDPFVEIVGKVPDVDVAHKAGVTPQAVRNYRKKHGIAAPKRRSRGSKRAAATGAAAATASSPPVSGSVELLPRVAEGNFAWLVSFSTGERRIAAAPSASALVAHASTSGLGSVTAIERLAPMLPDSVV